MSSVTGKISIIVTAHDYAHFLPECLDSVLRQSFTNYELVVVDDGSTDNTQEVLESYGSKIDKIVKLDGKGVAIATNVGVRESTGEYLLRLDADDTLADDILEKLFLEIEKNDSLGMVYPNFFITDVAGNVLQEYNYNAEEMESLNSESVPLGACALFRRECFDALAGCDERLRYEEDYDFWHRFIRNNTIKNVKNPLFFYRRHGSNKSHRSIEKRDARRYIKNKIIEEFAVPERGAMTAVFSESEGMDEDLLSLIEISLNSKDIDIICVLQELESMTADKARLSDKVKFLCLPDIKLSSNLLDLLSSFANNYSDLCDGHAAILGVRHTGKSLLIDDINEAMNNIRMFNSDMVVGVESRECSGGNSSADFKIQPAFAVKAGSQNRTEYTDPDTFKLVSLDRLGNNGKSIRDNRISYVLIDSGKSVD